MNELVSVIAIIVCIAAIGFVIKIYKESPKIKNNNENE